MSSKYKYYKPDDVNVSYNGISFTGLLTIVFIVLKLTKVINWPWVWVLAPLWVSLILFVFICIVFYFFIRHR